MSPLYKKFFINRYVQAFLLILPIIVFYLPMLLTGDRLQIGDFDMQVQMTEAARKIITEYHQFPFWNPWVSGGVPLFGDPQFGLLTPQTLLSFFVGSVFAWKLTIVLYLIAGFFSLRSLLNYLSDQPSYANTLIAYIWIFGSFFTLRATGHLTFLILALLPLAFLLTLKSRTSTKALFGLASLLTYCLYAAMHYSTILILICVLFIAVAKPVIDSLVQTRGLTFQSLIRYLKPVLVRVGLAVIIALVLASPRIYLSLEYLHDSAADRSAVYERFIGVPNGLRSILCPYQASACVDLTDFAQSTTWGFFEASSYIGIISLIVLAALVWLLYTQRKRLNIGHDKGILFSFSSLALFSFLLGMGGIPYHIIRQLPLMSSMRVSTRWFFITALCLLILTAILYNKMLRSKKVGSKVKKIFTLLLIIGFIEVAWVDFTLNNSLWIYERMHGLGTSVKNNDVLKQERLWEAPNALQTRYYALTKATETNRGQIVADNALVDTTLIPTARCDEDDPGCSFVISRNAKVIQWTPERIILKRTGAGVIELNMNPGSHWMINNTYPFLAAKIVDSTQRFLIDDTAQLIRVEYSPRPLIFK